MKAYYQILQKYLKYFTTFAFATFVQMHLLIQHWLFLLNLEILRNPHHHDLIRNTKINKEKDKKCNSLIKRQKRSSIFTGIYFYVLH